MERRCLLSNLRFYQVFNISTVKILVDRFSPIKLRRSDLKLSCFCFALFGKVPLELCTCAFLPLLVVVVAVKVLGVVTSRAETRSVCYSIAIFRFLCARTLGFK